jgi:hypothetical protein
LKHFTLVALLLLVAVSSVPIAVRQAHASGTLYVSPPHVAQQNVGTLFKVQIKVVNIDPFNAWDIEVRTDPNILNATSFTIYPNLFSKNYSVPAMNFYESTHCINGMGASCSNSTDGPGVVHSALVLLQAPPQTGPSSGLLLTITYQVTTNGQYSPIEILNDIIANGATISQVSHITVLGVYGTSGSDFGIASSSPSVTVAEGSSANSTITLTSISSFSGTVHLTVASNVSGLTVTLNHSTVELKAGGTNSSSLTVSATLSLPAISYNGAIRLNGTSLLHLHSVSLSAGVTPPAGITVGLSPSQLLIHAGNSATSTVTVESKYGFSGLVSLRANVSSRISPVSNVVASLNVLSLKLMAYGEFNATLTIAIPASHFRFSYTITVFGNGTSASNSATLDVFPPPGDVSVIVNPSPITIQAGTSVDATIHVAGQDYLWGTVNIAASMSNGAAHLGNTTLVIPPGLTPDNFNVTLSIAIDRTTLPGNYVLTLTVYTLCFAPSGQANNCQKGQDSLRNTQNLNITVTPAPQGSSTPSSPTSILGLAPPIYFGILGVFALFFLVLSVQTYRKRE